MQVPQKNQTNLLKGILKLSNTYGFTSYFQWHLNNGNTTK